MDSLGLMNPRVGKVGARLLPYPSVVPEGLGALHNAVRLILIGPLRFTDEESEAVEI